MLAFLGTVLHSIEKEIALFWGINKIILSKYREDLVCFESVEANMSLLCDQVLFGLGLRHWEIQNLCCVAPQDIRIVPK